MTHRSLLAGISYVIGIVAFLLVILDSREDELFSFHIRQALLLNIVVVVLGSFAASRILPMYVRTLPIVARPGAFIGAVAVLGGAAAIFLAVLGVRAYLGHRFRVPGIAWLAEKMAS